jgi:predicted nucleic acid-binding protein/plasmid stability protein
MPTITLKNIPEDLHRKLKKRAEEHHRSLNREVLATLRSATNQSFRLEPAALIREARAVRRKFRRPDQNLDTARPAVIVVDTNIICYRWIPTSHSPDTDKALANDPDWIAPLLWRSEFRNALAGAIRQKLITMDVANNIMDKAEGHFLDREFAVSSRAVLDLVASSACSAYDCEFVALAEEQRVLLITADRQILRDFPRVAMSLEKFARG